MIYPQIIINTDGGARGNPGPAAIGVIAKTPDGTVLFELSEYIGSQTNNVAEYTAVIHALNHLDQHQLQASKINFILDSELIVRQIQGIYRVKEPNLQKLHTEVKKLLSGHSYTFTSVSRSQNKRADKLVNQALDSQK
ncbi:ribonuclease HI family protein [Candidatus Woesebacteria bacterium]|nr:ribonuclease HI family protein [Candidatus Woesebacteria bacterium]